MILSISATTIRASTVGSGGLGREKRTPKSSRRDKTSGKSFHCVNHSSFSSSSSSSQQYSKYPACAVDVCAQPLAVGASCDSLRLRFIVSTGTPIPCNLAVSLADCTRVAIAFRPSMTTKTAVDPNPPLTSARHQFSMALM